MPRLPRPSTWWQEGRLQRRQIFFHGCNDSFSTSWCLSDRWDQRRGARRRYLVERQGPVPGLRRRQRPPGPLEPRRRLIGHGLRLDYGTAYATFPRDLRAAYSRRNNYATSTSPQRAWRAGPAPLKFARQARRAPSGGGGGGENDRSSARVGVVGRPERPCCCRRGLRRKMTVRPADLAAD